MLGYWTPSIKLQMTYCNNDLVDVGLLIPSDTTGSDIFKDISGNALKVLIVLASHMSSTEYSCYPTIDQISNETGLSNPSVHACIKQLVSLGVISQKEQRKSRRNPQYMHNIYYLSKKFIEVITVDLIDSSEKVYKKYFSDDGEVVDEASLDKLFDELEEVG